MPPKEPAKDHARVRTRQQQLRAERAAGGVCSRCGKAPPVPGRSKCEQCLERQRAADRARRVRAKAQGKLYGGRDPVASRLAARAADKRRRRARRDAGLCTSCGLHPPADGRSVCEPCREAQRTTDRARYAARSAGGLCTRCGRPAFGGASRCGRCAALEAERTSPERKSATNRKRYARRRARGVCVDCGVHAEGSARCERCAYRSNARAPMRHLVLPWPPQYAVIEIETGIDLGTFEAEAEVAACLVFAGLRPDQVEIRSNVPLMSPSLSALP